MSVARTAIERILVLLRAASGLSDRADRVMIGEPPVTLESVPRVYLSPTGIASAHDDQLGSYRRTLTLSLVGYVGRSGTATEADGELVLAATDLLDTIAGALEADRTLSGSVVDLIVAGETFDGKVFQLPTVGIVVATVEIWWIAISGDGV